MVVGVSISSLSQYVQISEATRAKTARHKRSHLCVVGRVHVPNYADSQSLLHMVPWRRLIEICSSVPSMKLMSANRFPIVEMFYCDLGLIKGNE